MMTLDCASLGGGFSWWEDNALSMEVPGAYSVNTAWEMDGAETDGKHMNFTSQHQVHMGAGAHGPADMTVDDCTASPA